MHDVLKILCMVLVSVCIAQAASANNSMLMFKASQLVVQGKYQDAITMYDSLIAQEPENIEAYLQRAVAERELGQTARMQHDATTALKLANLKLALSPSPSRQAKLHYQRGTAYRFLKRFPEAKQDLTAALKLKDDAGWKMDLQAIALEEKMK